MLQDYNDRQELQQEVTDKAKNIETLGEEQQEHQEDLETLKAKLRYLQSKPGVYRDSDRNLQSSVEIAAQARKANVEVCKEKINVVKTELEVKVENLHRKIGQEKERTTQMEQAVESLNHRGEGVVNNITINIQQCKDDIVDAQDKENKFLKIIGVAAQIATAAEVSANVIGMVISGLQSLGLFR
jgi:chromosome segregation ATPase